MLYTSPVLLDSCDTSNTRYLETRLDIHEQVSYYMLYRDIEIQTSCVLETRLDIHEQVSYYMLYGDTSNTRYVLCLRD